MPFPELVLRPKPPPPKNINVRLHKPLFEIGSPVCAAWWPSERGKNRNPKYYHGVVKNYSFRKEKDCGYGPLILYDVLFDDETISCGIEDVYVYQKEDFLRLNKKWKGVTNKHNQASKDRWARESGWYNVNVEGVTRSFPRLTEAIRAYDEQVVWKKGPKTVDSDLNLPEEWSWLPRVVAVKPEMDSDEDCSDDESDDENVPLQELAENAKSRPPVKKKRRVTNLDDSSIDTSRTTKKSKRSNPATPLTEAVMKSKCSNYKGVSFRKADYKFMAYVTIDKMRFLGAYSMATDAAFVVDKVHEGLKVTGKMPNFASTKQYLDARNQEMKDSGIDSHDIGTFESLASTIADYVVKIKVEMSRSNKLRASQQVPASTEKRARKSALDSPATVTSKTAKPKSKPSPSTTNEMRNRCRDYKGVSLQIKKYMAYITLDKMRFLGAYILAADAAFAADKAKDVFKGSGNRRNFETLEKFYAARKQEMKKAGLVLTDVGTVESLYSTIEGYIAKMGNVPGYKIEANIKLAPAKSETKLVKSDAPKKRGPKPVKQLERTLPPKSATAFSSSQSINQVAALYPVPLQQKKKLYSSNYVGVNYDKRDKRYRVYVNQKYSGCYLLITDAAFAYDEISENVNGPGSRLHFTSEQQYQTARAQEMKDRSLTLDTVGVGTLQDIQIRITKYSQKPVGEDTGEPLFTVQKQAVKLVSKHFQQFIKAASNNDAEAECIDLTT